MRIAAEGDWIEVPTIEPRVVVDRRVIDPAALAKIEREAVAAGAQAVGDRLHARLDASAVVGEPVLLDEVVIALAKRTIERAALRMAQWRLGAGIEDLASQRASSEASGRRPVRAIEWRA